MIVSDSKTKTSNHDSRKSYVNGTTAKPGSSPSDSRTIHTNGQPSTPPAPKK